MVDDYDLYHLMLGISSLIYMSCFFYWGGGGVK